MADQDYKKELAQAKSDINSLVVELKKVDQQLIKTSELAREMGLAFKPTSPNEINSQLQKQKEVISQLNKELAKLKGTTDDLNKAKQRQKNITSEEIIGQRELKKNADLQAKSTMKLVGAYQNLISKQRQARTTLRNLIVSEKANEKQIKKAQREYDKLTRKVNQANKATSNFAKTGLGNALRGFKNLIGAFGIAGGAMLFANMTRNVFNLIKTLNSLDFTMKAVIKDQAELGQTQLWLSDITMNFGAALVTTTNRYIKFRAATQQAGLSARETQNIFGTMTKAAGVLGLKTDELTGIFLALEQMVSKGKITTEELRRQLGERLPGAMDIMANSLNVTTAELDDMLKKGQVITKDVLPGFARQVEIAFGLENVNRVETLQAATIRLSNTWIELVQEFENGNAVSKDLMRVFDFLAKNLGKIVILAFNAAKAFLAYKTVIIATTLITRLWTTATVAAKIATILFTKGLKAARTAMVALNIASTANPFVLIAKVLIGLVVAIWAFKDSLDFSAASQEVLNEAIEDGEKIADEYSKTINEKLVTAFSKLARKQQELLGLTEDIIEQEEIRKGINQEKIKLLETERAELSKLIIEYTAQLGLYAAGTPIYEKYKKVVLELAKKYSLLAEEIRELNKVTKDEQNFIEGSVGWLREQISANDKLIAQSKDRSLIKQLQDRNKGHQKEIDLLLGKTKALKKAKDANKELILNNTAPALKKQIDMLELVLSRLKLATPAYAALAGMIKFLKDVYKDLTFEQGKSNDKLKETVGFTTNSEKAFNKNINALEDLRDSVKKGSEEWKLYNALIKAAGIQSKILGGELKELTDLDIFKIGFKEVTDTFADVFDIDISKFDFLFDEMENSMSDWASLSKELIGSVLDASLRRYELELIEAQRTRDLIVDNEFASAEQKEAARKRFDSKERQIKLNRAKKERDNTLIQIAVDTAAAIVKVTAQTGVLAPFVIPGIIAIGLAQAAIVASQPLPKFEKGTTNAPKGMAVTQEKRAEPITDMYGRLKTMGSDSGPMLTPLAEHDVVYPSRDEFFRRNSGEAINKAVWNMNMASNGQELGKKFVDNSLLNEMKGLRKDNVDMNKKIMKLGSRPIKNNVTVEIADNRAY